MHNSGNVGPALLNLRQFHEDTNLNIPAHAPLHLLHQANVGTLATNARQPQGYPYPTVLPFAPDARHRPTLLVSGLAEHTRNLHADPRAGFLIVHAVDGDVLEGQRATLVGVFEPVEAAPALVARYLRYHPAAERYLALGDFAFWTMSIERLRYIGGFGAMGWVDGSELDALAPLASDEEASLIHFFEHHPRRAANVELAGVDRYGADLRMDGARTRFVFDAPKADSTSLHGALADCVDRHAIR